MGCPNSLALLSIHHSCAIRVQAAHPCHLPPTSDSFSWRHDTMDTRLNGTVSTLRIAIGLMATLAGLDKFFNLLTNWEAYVAPATQLLVPFSTTTFMAIVGVIEFVVGITVL